MNLNGYKDKADRRDENGFSNRWGNDKSEGSSCCSDAIEGGRISFHVCHAASPDAIAGERSISLLEEGCPNKTVIPPAPMKSWEARGISLLELHIIECVRGVLQRKGYWSYMKKN